MFAFEQSPAPFLPVAGQLLGHSHSVEDVVVDGVAILDLENEEVLAVRECAKAALVSDGPSAPCQTLVTGTATPMNDGRDNAISSMRDLVTHSQRLGTPPIDISKTPTTTRGRSSVMLDPTPKATELTGRPHRKKKRAQKKGALAAALNANRAITPTTSCDEDSDFSGGSMFKKRDLSATRTLSIASNPGTRSCSPSELTRQLIALNTESALQKSLILRNKSKLGTETSSSASVTSEVPSEEDSTSYEIPLEHDFISPDAPMQESDGCERQSLLDQIARKMTATDFEPLRCLGKGTYGTVILVKHVATGRLYAQKQFRKASLTVRKQLVEQTKTERAILESINRHPFVVKLYYAFQDHEKLYLILEYAQGGELFTRMLTERMFSEEIASFYMAEMVLALEHLHQTVGVVYRDLKPENCLLDSEGHLLLTDFGLSKVAVDGDYRCKSMTGTLEYMAPEVIQQKHYGTTVDWWSLGILGFDLLTGSSPFSANNETKIKERILKSKLILPYFLSADAKDLLTRLLRKEPKKRLGANMPKDMHTIKTHRFFRKIDWKKLEKRELEPPIKPLVTDPEMAENFSADFTDLALSPLCDRDGKFWADRHNESDPFGGFSFVASSSVLESGNGFF